MSTYRVAIIGAGDVGSGADSPNSKEFLTHAHAIANNPSLSLAALVDTNAGRAVSEAKRWNTKAYTTVKDMFAEEKPDIVGIATPDDTHAHLLEEIVKKNVQLIVLEKPVVTSDEEAKHVSHIPISMPVVVNFRRRFDPVVQKLARDLTKGTYGEVLSARGTYVRGLLHNGSHMLDLARLLFGEIRSAQADSRIDDFPEGMGTIGGKAVFERCPEFTLVAKDGRKGFVFGLEIVTEKKRFHFTDEGLQLSIANTDGSHEENTKTGLDMAFPTLYAHCVALIEGKEAPLSTLENGLKTHAACMLFAGDDK